MPEIRIDTERARDVGRRLIAEGDRLAETGLDLKRAMSGLDTWAWDGNTMRDFLIVWIFSNLLPGAQPPWDLMNFSGLLPPWIFLPMSISKMIVQR